MNVALKLYETVLVADYNARERGAMASLPNRAIEACAPAGFNHTNYPTRVTDKRELWRYADTMHDRRAKPIFDRLCGLTKRELKLFEKAVCRAALVTEAFGHRLVPINAPLAAVTSYRLVKSFYDGGNVFEIGPGSGYLGAMLQGDGFSYSSVDVTQAFHLWQQSLLGPQMPWWEWIDHKRPDFAADVIVVNHAINEMRDAALSYMIVRAERMLSASGMMLAENLGASYMRQAAKTMEMFHQREWTVMNLEGSSFAFVPPGRVPPVRKADETPTQVWSDIESIWQKLGATPNPDDEFADFLEHH